MENYSTLKMLNYTVLLLTLVLSLNNLLGQSVRYLPSLPEGIANNAVVGDPETGAIYSFSGIDSSLEYSGIHARSYYYHPSTLEWLPLDNLPGELPRIAASASLLNDTIYIVGGYQVFENGSELSLKETHRFDIRSNSFSSDAPDILLAIDDHVQAVVGDSAIIQFSGWSNTGNTGWVQHYKPKNQSWTESTRIRNQFLEAFGAAGVLLNDTIYYIGGAADVFNFPIQPYLRKGAINTENIQEIKWSYSEHPIAATYRPGSYTYDGKAYWVGGGMNTYNYDGIAYDGSGSVLALSQLLEYDPATGRLRKVNVELPAVMVLRGIAQISEHEFCVVGGMNSQLEVLSEVWCIDMSILSNSEPRPTEKQIRLLENPVHNFLRLSEFYDGNVSIFSQEGKTMWQGYVNGNTISVESLSSGIYFLHLGDLYPRQTIQFLK